MADTIFIKNPFYLGYISHNFLNGQVVKGNHEALISMELFMAVNKLRRKETYKHKKANADLPLKGFVRDYETSANFTGYLAKKKNLYYYKVNKPGVNVNRSQVIMHDKFIKILEKYSITDFVLNLFQNNCPAHGISFRTKRLVTKFP